MLPTEGCACLEAVLQRQQGHITAKNRRASVGFESFNILIDLPPRMANGKEVLQQMSGRGSLDAKRHA